VLGHHSISQFSVSEFAPILAQVNSQFVSGGWLPIKYVGRTKEEREPSATAHNISEQDLAAYLALNAKIDDGSAARVAIIQQMQVDIMAEINRAQILNIANQASLLMAQEEEDLDLILLSS
jgi:hypothetical protein